MNNRGRSHRGHHHKPKVDLPNLTLVTYAYLLVHFPRDVINVDPLSSLKDEAVRATNLSQVAKHISEVVSGRRRWRGSWCSVQLTVLMLMMVCATSTINVGKWDPPLLSLLSLIPGANICSVKLVPGKYDQGSYPPPRATMGSSFRVRHWSTSSRTSLCTVMLKAVVSPPSMPRRPRVSDRTWCWTSSAVKENRVVFLVSRKTANKSLFNVDNTTPKG